MRSCISEETLQAWFDGELASTEAAKVATHLNTCIRCAEAAHTVESENLILSEALAAEFVAAVPTERLRQRVETAVAVVHEARVPVVSESRWRAAREFFGSWQTLAYASVAATILLAGVLGLVYLRKEPATHDIVKNDPPAALPVISKDPTGRPPIPAPPISPKIEKGRRSKAVDRRDRSPASEPEAMSLMWQERQYDYAITRLNEAIKIQPPMRPSLQVEYEYNMAVIDNAIATGRDAARRHPKDPQAAQFMLAAYQSKVDLLNQVANARVQEK